MLFMDMLVCAVPLQWRQHRMRFAAGQRLIAVQRAVNIVNPWGTGAEDDDAILSLASLMLAAPVLEAHPGLPVISALGAASIRSHF